MTISGDEYVQVGIDVADIVEDYLQRHPEHHHLTQGRYEVDPPGDSVACLRTIEPSLYDTMKETEPETVQKFSGNGMTGMQWDIALSIARRRIGLGSTPSVSMMEIEADD